MEEGPEPQEFLEHVEHSLHEKHEEHGEGHDEGGSGAKNKHMRSAITAAILAVFAALGSLLSGHAANEAILLQTKASDQWTYYQAKSTKSHLYEVNKTLIEALIQSKGDSKSAANLEELTKRIDGKMKGYEKEKSEIEEKATDLEKESSHEFAEHQMYSFAVACFQICIVLASVSILVDSSALYLSSVIGGVIGVGLLVYGYVMK
jgi:hypothetical protein